MRQIETTYRSVPLATGSRSRFSSWRAVPKPEFLSQVIAARENLNVQRVKRQATPFEVLKTYDAGGKLRVLRVPPGYRTDILA